jgi:hypothetical protein
VSVNRKLELARFPDIATFPTTRLPGMWSGEYRKSKGLFAPLTVGVSVLLLFVASGHNAPEHKSGS